MHITTEHWLWLLGSLAQAHGLPFDAKLIQRDFPPPLDEASLRRAGDALGLLISPHRVERTSLSTLPTPFVAWKKYTPETSATESASQVGETSQPILILRIEQERILYFEAGSEAPLTIATAQFTSLFEPDVLLVKRILEVRWEQDGEAPLSPPFNLRWFLPEFLKYKHIWRDVLIVSAVLQILGLTTPLLTQVVIDKVVVHQTMSTLTVVGVGLAIALLFSAGFSWLRQYLVIHTGNRIDAVLGSAVFSHLLRLPLPYFQHRPTGVLIARLRGVETIREFLSGAAVTFLLDLPFMIVLLAVMFIYSWQLSLISIGLLILLTALSTFVTPVFRARVNEQFMAGARTQSFATEYTAGIETVKSLQMESKLEARYGELLAEYMAAGFKTRLIANSYNTVANALDQIQTLAILVVGALLVIRSDGFTIGMLVAFQMFSGRLSQPVLRLVGLYQEMQQTQIAVQRLGDIMNMPKEPHSLTPARINVENGNGVRIEMQALSFRYADQAPWLYRNLHLNIPPGRTAAIMGPSGCGKSTLAKLLQGFYWPQEGQIKIDGADLRTLPANVLRAYLGVVPQETVLFSGTLYDNLHAAQPHASFEDIVTACRMAEIHDYIESLPEGYQTIVGERGVGLSGGQRQRIAIARALLKRPKILIFDEATSNLDSQTAEHFAKTVNQLKGAVTMLFIAHQIPKGLQVDGIVRLGEQVSLAAAEEAEADHA